jgi:anthranilate synthase component 1
VTGPTLAAGEILPLVRRLGGCPDPLALYATLTAGGRAPDTLLLESADSATGQGERSVLVVGAALRLTCRGGEVTVRALSANGRAILPWMAESLARLAPTRVNGDHVAARFPRTSLAGLSDVERVRVRSPLDAVRLAALGPRLVSEPAPHAHLCVGVFAYDLIDQFEDLPAPRLGGDGWPAFECWVPDRVIVVDHLRRITTVLASVFGGGEPGVNYHDAVRAIEALTRAVQAAPATGGGATGPGAMPADAASADANADLSDEEFAALVERFQKHIAAGEIYQAVPSRTFRASCRDALAAYAALRSTNPSPYMFFVQAGAGTLFGASPETCVRVDAATRTVTLRPIAGTAPRARAADGTPDAELEARLETALRTDAKELAEHLMLVDLARNDVARVSRAGTRRVARLLDVDRFSHVMHLVSEVTGELAEGLDALHAYAAVTNMGTVTGAPKLRAAELLRVAERDARGPYGGAVGYLTHAGDMDTAIVIRSAVVRDGVAAVRAGAGVVAASDPARESRETRAKAAGVLDALATAEAAHG